MNKAKLKEAILVTIEGMKRMTDMKTKHGLETAEAFSNRFYNEACTNISRRLETFLDRDALLEEEEK